MLERLRRWWQRAGWAWRTLTAAPVSVRLVVIAVIGAAAFMTANIVYQVIRKPTELFYPVRYALNKAPAETWRDYGPLFRRYSTATVTPELLAALAQVEGAGNPVAHTYWRWRLTWRPFEVYEPASSAVGMYQMTAAAFADAQHYCIRQHIVVEEGCWSDGLYTRIMPGDAIELTAALLDRNVAAVLADAHIHGTAAQRQQLAAVVHLCGMRPATEFARRGFHPGRGEHCGDHDVADYLARVDAMKREFLRLAAEE
ncbi:MAG TPA: hypothetical protein VLV85_11570 [Stellaceae bacterium]|nr:hypothetical protein [Stellaceae bacterium]